MEMYEKQFLYGAFIIVYTAFSSICCIGKNFYVDEVLMRIELSA